MMSFLRSFPRQRESSCCLKPIWVPAFAGTSGMDSNALRSSGAILALLFAPVDARRPFTRAAMPDNLDVTKQLAQFVADTQWNALSPPVVHQAKRALVIFFAVALLGCREPTIETTLRSLVTFSGAKQATVIGRSERLDALSAAFINAASANVLDFCDTHVPTVIHPTAPVA